MENEVCIDHRILVKKSKLNLPVKIYKRSKFFIFLTILTPFLFLFFVVLLAAMNILPTKVAFILYFLLLLAAHRCFQTIVHDLSHKLICTNRAMNDFLGNILVAGMTGSKVQSYRAVHMNHHKYNGSFLDPEHIDFEAVMKKGGLLIFILRYIFLFECMRLFKKYYSSSSDLKSKPRHIKIKNFILSKWHILLSQIFLFSLFFFLAHNVLLYIIWLYLAVSWSPLLSTLRFLVEHPGKDSLTVTTKSNFLELIYFAPFNFNYHFEHHLFPAVPPYRLRKLHNVLREIKLFDKYKRLLNNSFLLSLIRRAK